MPRPISLEKSAVFIHPRHILSSREVPKLGGSEAAFIALIVILCVIILCACTAVVYLLYYHESATSNGHNTNRRYQHQSVPSSSSAAAFAYSQSTTKPPSKTNKLASMFQKRTKGDRTGPGWVQQGSGDEWDYGSDEEGTPGFTMIGGARVAGLSPNTPPLDTPFHPPQISPSNSNSYSSIQFDPHAPGLASYANPSQASPIPSRRPTIETQMESSSARGVGTPLRTTTPDPIPGHAHIDLEGTGDRNGNGKRDSGTSSVRTFTGGTKFLEGL